MIILVDNKDYMIKLCKDSPDIHGFDVFLPGWQGVMRLYSDIGMMSLVSGKEAEDYLDKNKIYYIHIEDEGETYKEFLVKLVNALMDNEEYILLNNTFGKLVYGLTEDLEKATIETDNILEIWRYNEDGRYYLDITLAEELNELPSYVLKSVCDSLLDRVVADLAPSMEAEDLAKGLVELEEDWDGDYDNLFSADNLKAMIINIAKILKDIYTGEYTGE